MVPTSHLSRRALVGAAVLALCAPVAVSAAAPASATTPAAQCATSWPADVKGKPTVKVPDSRTGAWMWQDSKGFHIRVSHSGSGKKIFTGKIRSTSAMHSVGVRIEGRDVVARTADRRTMTFRFVNWGGVDGVDFKVSGCTPSISVLLAMSGEKLPVSAIHLGADASAPATNSFRLTRS